MDEKQKLSIIGMSVGIINKYGEEPKGEEYKRQLVTFEGESLTMYNTNDIVFPPHEGSLFTACNVICVYDENVIAKIDLANIVMIEDTQILTIGKEQMQINLML